MTLTPKEKAKELVGKYVKFKLNGLFKFFGLELSKQCAIIAVDEIIKALMYPPQLNSDRQIIHIKVLQYWKEVKKEIELL
jgi:hypothetical protein